MELRFVYMTCADEQEAKKIAHHLVDNRLAACVNILGKIESYYWWEGKPEENSEISLIAKTKLSLVEPLIQAVKSFHSYSCPCIITLPITEGNSDFLAYLMRETR
jgi:periplasmic divalent cation tolerance protein